MPDHETKGPNQSTWKRFSKVAALWAMIILASVMLAQMLKTEEMGQDVTYSELLAEIERGNVAEVTYIHRTALDGTFRTPITTEESVTPISRFRTPLPVMDSEGLLNSFRTAGVTINARGP